MADTGKSAELVLVQQAGAGHSATITINRPEVRNAANQETWRLIGEAVRRLSADADLRSIVITGAGDKAFMSGADVSEFPHIVADPARIQAYTDTVMATCDAIEASPVPVIACMNGHAIGGGLEMAFACDYRLGITGTRFGIPSADVGLAIIYADIERIVTQVGSQTAKELLIFGRVFNAEEALQKGIVNEIVPPERLQERTRELVDSLANKAPLSVRSAKRVIQSIIHDRYSAGGEVLRDALDSVRVAWESAEFKQRVDRMVSKR